MADLVWRYQVVFHTVDMQTENLFEFNTRPSVRGHKYKLHKKHSASQVRATFFCERVRFQLMLT